MEMLEIASRSISFDKKKWVSPENLRLVLTGRYCITTVKKGFQLAAMDILYIKMLEIARSSISFDKKNGCRPKI